MCDSTMDSLGHEEDDEADEYEEEDELFRQDMEALKRACVLTGVDVEAEASAGSRASESGNETEEIDDMEFVRSIQKKFCLPINLNARISDGPSDLDEDDFETLRAIERRFAKYDNDEAKKKVDSMQHDPTSIIVNSAIGSGTSFEQVTGSSNTISMPLILGSSDYSRHADHSIDLSGHDPEKDELSTSTVASLTKSHFSDSARVFIEAVKKNRLCQKFIRSKLIQIEAMISENKELISRMKCLVDFQMSCKRQATRLCCQETDARVKLISLPDARKQSKKPKDLLGPRENSHVSLFRRVLSKFPSTFKRKSWSTLERENLVKGVKQQIQEFLLRNSMEHLCGSEEYLTQPNCLDTAIAEINNLNITPEHIRSFLPQVSWNRLASMYLKDRSGTECRARWLCREDPLINHNPWNKSEDKQLLFIVQQSGPYDWIHIAETLGMNRTASQCLSRYQRSLNANILRSNWTEEEDAQLRAAVEAFGENNWQLVASHLEGRTGDQCSNRWRKSLHPSRERFGRWTVEEDKRLKIAVTLFGPRNWKKISGFIPGRTQVQCRDRWLNSLNPSIKLDTWAEEEDLKLKAAIMEHGRKWSKVAACVPQRTDGQCRRRWKVLFPHEVAQAQIARKIKKSALISNFVYRSKERPALGPDDFVHVQADAAIVDVENANGGKSKKRKRGFKMKDKLTELDTCDTSQPVRCKRSRAKNVAATTETMDCDETLSISKSHKSVTRRKANPTGKECVLYQGPSREITEAANGDKMSLTSNLHKRVEKRKVKSTGEQIISPQVSEICTWENGSNFVYRSKEQPAICPDDFVHVQADAAIVDVENAHGGKSKKRKRSSKMKDKLTELDTCDTSQPVRCKRSRAESVEVTTETVDGDETLSISKSHKSVKRRKVNPTGKECVLYQGPDREITEAPNCDKTPLTSNLHKRVKKRKVKSTGEQIISPQVTEICTWENGGDLKDNRTQAGKGDVAHDSMDDRVGVFNGHRDTPENVSLGKTQTLRKVKKQIRRQHGNQVGNLETRGGASCGSRKQASLMQKTSSKQGVGCSNVLMEKVTVPEDISSFGSTCENGSLNSAQNAEIISCTQENPENALLTNGNGCIGGFSVEMGNVPACNADETIDLLTVRINAETPDFMSCLPSSISHGANAICEVVFDNGVADGVRDLDSSLGPVFGSSSSDLNMTRFIAPACMEVGDIQQEGNMCSEKVESVGQPVSDSDHLASGKLESLLSQGIKSNGNQKEPDGESFPLIQDSACVLREKGDIANLSRTGRTTRSRISYKEMLRGNFDFFGRR